MKLSLGGFTLVELLLTMSLVGVGLARILFLLATMSEYRRQLRDKDRMESFASSVFSFGVFSPGCLGLEVLSEEEATHFPSLVGNQEF